MLSQTGGKEGRESPDGEDDYKCNNWEDLTNLILFRERQSRFTLSVQEILIVYTDFILICNLQSKIFTF